MKKIRITVMRMASYPDLSAAYENPLELQLYPLL